MWSDILFTKSEQIIIGSVVRPLYKERIKHTKYSRKIRKVICLLVVYKIILIRIEVRSCQFASRRGGVRFCLRAEWAGRVTSLKQWKCVCGDTTTTQLFEGWSHDWTSTYNRLCFWPSQVPRVGARHTWVGLRNTVLTSNRGIDDPNLWPTETCLHKIPGSAEDAGTTDRDSGVERLPTW